MLSDASQGWFSLAPKESDLSTSTPCMLRYPSPAVVVGGHRQLNFGESDQRAQDKEGLGKEWETYRVALLNNIVRHEGATIGRKSCGEELEGMKR